MITLTEAQRKKLEMKILGSLFAYKHHGGVPEERVIEVIIDSFLEIVNEEEK